MEDVASAKHEVHRASEFCRKNAIGSRGGVFLLYSTSPVLDFGAAAFEKRNRFTEGPLQVGVTDLLSR